MRQRERELIVCIVRNTMRELWKRSGDSLPQEIEKSLMVKSETEQWGTLAEEAANFLESQGNAGKQADTVACIFNNLNGHQTSMVWDAAGKTLLEGVSYPASVKGAWKKEDFVRIQKKILEDLRYFEMNDMYLDVLLDALEDSLFYVPSACGNEETSMFQHMKMSMAIGTCLQSYFEKLPDAEAALKEQALMLVSMDISGIQDFIYTISSKGALKSLRARSFYLEIMMEHMVDEILEALDLGRCNLIYSGGGHCYLLVPAADSAKAVVETKMRAFNEWMLSMFQTDLYVGHGMCPCSVAELKDQPSGSYANIFQTVSRQISAKKMHRYTAEQIRMLNAQDQGDGTRECAICKRMGRLNEANHCEFCDNLLRFSKNILKQEYFAVTDQKHAEGLPLPGDVYVVPANMDEQEKYKPVRIYKKNGPDRKWYRAKEIFVGDYAAKETLEELADNSDGIERLAIYRADVDNLGNAFVSGFKNPATGKNKASLSKTAVLSKHLSLFFKYYINQFLEKEKYEIAVVYAGGDDLFILGAWSDVIDAALKLQEELETYTQGTLTLSGGIGIYSPSYPVRAMAEEAADLEDCSKQQPGKNAITLFSEEHSFSWEVFREKVMGEKYHVLDEYFSNVHTRGNSFLYHLLELIRKCDNKVNFVRYVYLLSRMEPEHSRENEEEWDAYQKFSQKMYQWIQKEEDRKHLIAAIYIYVYKNRKKESDDEINE